MRHDEHGHNAKAVLDVLGEPITISVVAQADKAIGQEHIDPIGAVDDASGIIPAYAGNTDSVDVALRRMMTTELSQASGRATLANLDAAGWQLAHTDAHYGARPSHAEWQGRPFGVNGPVVVDGVEYPGMAELTGYGTATGLKGVNCRHTIEVYVPGETEPPDTEFKEDSAAHNGMTSEEYYQAVQRQRALERAVRGTRYQVAMMEKMGMGLEHPSYVQKRLELGNWQAKLAKHCKANNLTRIPSREQAYGIGKQPKGLTGRKWSESEKGISGKTMKSEGAKVNLDYIKSPEYRKKFEGLTPYRNVNMELHKCAVAALTHRNGTTYEDLYLVSIEDGKVKAKNTSSKTYLSVGATSTINKAVEDNRGMLIGLHNHPSNVPPSGADFAASGYRNYAFGLVVLHNGEVYKYKHGNIPFLARGFDDCVERQRQKGYNEKEAFEIAMKEYSDRVGITWEKIQ